MTRTQLRRLIEAHDEVWLGWWPRLTGLTASQARRTLEGRWPSVLAMTDHMVDTERYWQDRLESREGRDRPIRGETMAQLERAWTRLRDRRLAWLDRADLRQRVWFTAADGNVVHVSSADCLIHVATHAHFHRGQLVMHFRQLGQTPPSLHLLESFFGESSRPAPRLRPRR